MTVSTTTTRNDYIATNGQTVFAYTFKVLAATDMVVVKNGVTQAGYSITNLGVATGGNVTLTSGAAAGDTVSIYLAMPVTRETNYQEGGAFLAGDVNADFDKIYIGAIQNENAVSRSMRLNPIDPVPVDMTLPLKDARKGRYLQFNTVTGAPEAGQSIIGDYSAGTGLDLNNYVFSIDSTVATLSGTQTLTNKTLSSPVLDASISGSAFLDEDNMASNSDTKLASQQSIKAYVDSQVGTVDTLSEVLSNGNTTGGSSISFGDNDKATFGASDDLQIYHDGSNSIIKDSGTGILRYTSSNSSTAGVVFEIENTDSTNLSGSFIHFKDSFGLTPAKIGAFASELYIMRGSNNDRILTTSNGSAELYYSDDQKLTTTSTGIDVTGTATMDGLSVSSATSSNSTFINGVGTGMQITLADQSWSAGINQNAGSLYLQAGGLTNRLKLASNGDISFYEDTGTTPKLFWDASAESLGIGTSSPRTTLDFGIPTLSSTLSNSLTAYQVMLEAPSGTGKYAHNIGWSESTGSAVTVAAINAVDEGSSSATGIAFATGNNSAIAERLRIDSSGRVGIGTSSPTSRLTVASGTDSTNAGDGIHFLGSSINNQAAIQSFNTGAYDGDLRFYTSDHASASTSIGAERMRIDSSGNLLVGTTSTDPAASSTETGVALKSGGFVSISRNDSAASVNINKIGFDGSLVDFRKGGTTVGSIGSHSGGGTYFYSNSGSDSGLTFWSNVIAPSTSSGGFRDAVTDLGASGGRFKDLYLSGTANVGIVSLKDGNNNGQINATTSGAKIYYNVHDAHIWQRQGSEKARIDSSGNLLVGTTSSSLSNSSSSSITGINLNPNSASAIARDGGTVLYLNRISSDGDIVQLRKDGATVGSIGTASSGDLYIADGRNAGIKLDGGNNQVLPVTSAGSPLDATLDLGSSGGRFKDLYLSGGVYLGGTGAANKLDDYEEGTFTPTIWNGTVSYTTQRGRYTKIGRVVHIHCFIHIASISGSNSTNIVTGLPFTSKNDINYTALASKTNGFDYGGASTMITFQVVPNSTNISAVGSGNNQNFRDVNSNGLSANDWIAFSGHYVTDS